MAFLCTETFLAGSDGKAVDGGKTLQNRLGAALRNLTGRSGVVGKRSVHDCADESAETHTEVDRVGLDYPHAPVKLKPDRDFLADDWQQTWKDCTIEFADNEPGASIYVPERRIRFGPFFVLHSYTVTDFEKIILHEYLHAAFSFDNSLKSFHHGMMEQVLIYNLGYRPPANPVSVD